MLSRIVNSWIWISAGGPAIPGMLKLVDAALQTASVTQKGADLQITLSIKADVPAVVQTLIGGVQKVRQSANRAQSANNLRQIALAMHNYHDSNGHFPAQAIYSKDGKPLLSWRVLLLPYLDQDALYRQFKLDEAWDGPHNEKLLAQMPKLFAGQYNAEISTVLGAKADVVHSSFWDGDLEAFILQAGPRGLFKRSTVILTTGETAMYKLAEHIPDGVVIGARGPYGPYAPDNELNRWFSKTFADRYGVPPNYAAYQMAQAILGTKAAWEKAQSANGGNRPSTDQAIAAFERLTFESPAGKVEMVIGAGHQAITETAYGVSKLVKGKMTVANVKRYPATMVNPPDGVKAADWIANGFKK